MWNDELNTFNYFLCLCNHDLQYLGPVFTNCTNAPNTQKQVKVDPQVAFGFESGVIWCEMTNWRLWINHGIPLTMICGIWALFGPHSPYDTNAWNTLKQVKLDIQMDFGFKKGIIWCEMMSWWFWITFDDFGFLFMSP